MTWYGKNSVGCAKIPFSSIDLTLMNDQKQNRNMSYIALKEEL